MKTFKDLNFRKQSELESIGMHKYSASLDLNNYTISVIHGDSCYGNGPEYNTFEVAVYEQGHDDPVPLQSDKNMPVLGWVTSEEITVLMKILQQEPGFGDACRVFQRTRYNKRFSNISNLSNT